MMETIEKKRAKLGREAERISPETEKHGRRGWKALTLQEKRKDK